MRYFKIILACFGFIIAVVGATAGILYLTGGFNKQVVQPEDISFSITEKLTEGDFEVVVNTATEGVTEKDITLSLTNQTEKDGYITDGVVTVPKIVKLGQAFTVQVNKTTYEGIDEPWNVGGTSTIRAKSNNPLIQEATPLVVEVDVPVYSLGVELYSISGKKLGTVSADEGTTLLKTQAEEDEEKTVELAVGSVVNLKPVFVPANSAYTTKGELRKVLFEIPTAWKGIHIDFVDGSNDAIEILRQTTIEDIKINCYCFKTSADEYAANTHNYSNDELITIMNEKGIQGESAKLFGTNQKINNFTSQTNDEYLSLAINKPTTLFANKENVGSGEYNLGLSLSSDAGEAKLEDKIAVVRLYAYKQDTEGDWIDAGNKLVIDGSTLSTRTGNGIKAKINKKNADLSTWKVIASEVGIYKLVVKLEYEYYSSSSTVPTVINFEVEYENIFVADAISSDVSWNSNLPPIKTVVILDGENLADKYYPTINLAEYVNIENENATYKVVKYFAYSTEEVNLTNVINCSLYASDFDVPESSETYEIFEIPNGILTVKDVGTFKIFFATIVTDYLGNPTLQGGLYKFDSSSNTCTINGVKSLKSISASMTVNKLEDDDTKDYNKNTDEETKGYIFHVRQQDEKVFTLSLVVSDTEIFERDFNDGKISIDFLINGEKTNLLKVVDTYVIDEEEKRIDFQISIDSLSDSKEPIVECKVSYSLDERLNTYATNDGNKVQIKVLNGYAQTIDFEVIKNAVPANSLENPILVNIDFSAGSDKVATSVVYSLIFNGEEITIENLPKVVINEDALNKTYSLSSSKPTVIAVTEDETSQLLSILGATEDTYVTVTATAEDGSGISTNMYFKVMASSQITFIPNESEIVIEGYQGNSCNFSSRYSAMATDSEGNEIDLKKLLTYSLLISDATLENSGKISFENNTLTINSTFGRDASCQLYITSDFDLTKIIPIRIASDISITSNYSLNDNGLNDADFINRGESVPTTLGTRIYAENDRTITFAISQASEPDVVLGIDETEFILPEGVNLVCGSGTITINFDSVSVPTEKIITYKKNFSGESDAFAFTNTMKFIVYPNIKSSLSGTFGTQDKPASYISGETIVFDAKNYSNGLIKLERLIGEQIITENASVEAKIDGQWLALSGSEGQYKLPDDKTFRNGESVEVRVIYEGYALDSIKLYFNPDFGSLLPETCVVYDGVSYVPFVVGNSITLNMSSGMSYAIIKSSSTSLLKIEDGEIKQANTIFTKIITTEKLSVRNNNGSIELPIIILPIDYPFALYNDYPTKDSFKTYDLKVVMEKAYDTIEDGGEPIILSDKVPYIAGDNQYVVTITNQDGTTENYINYNPETKEIIANSVGSDQYVNVNIKCGAAFDEAFTFTYRLKVISNQEIQVFYPYQVYDSEEEYDVSSSYENVYFETSKQVVVNLLGEFNPLFTPNYAAINELYGIEGYARRFVVVRKVGENYEPMTYNGLHFSIASVGIGKTVVPQSQIANYAQIVEHRDVDNNLLGATLVISKNTATETVYVKIKAYTASGAEAYYNFKAIDEPVSYKVYYDNQQITTSTFQFASDGAASIDLNEKVLVKINKNPEQTVSPSAYQYYMIIEEQEDVDVASLVQLNGSQITMSALANDINTIIVILNEAGEIARFNFIVRSTIDYEVKKDISVNVGGMIDVTTNVTYFNSVDSSVYTMQDMKVDLFARSYLNGADTTSQEELFIRLGGYEIEDISTIYRQYVLLDNVKVYANDLFDDYGGKIDNVVFDVKGDTADKKYIEYNGNPIYFNSADKSISIPLTSASTDSITYTYPEIPTSITLPVFKFTSGPDTRYSLVYDVLATKNGEKEKFIKGTSSSGKYKTKVGTYVQIYINGNWIRYKVREKADKEVVSILYVNHNNQTYYAKVDEYDYDHEYIDIDDQKYYFTRFYNINYESISNSEKTNIPVIRYAVSKPYNNELSVELDLSKVLCFMNDKNSDAQNLLDEAYISETQDEHTGNNIYTHKYFRFYNGDDDGATEISIKKVNGKCVLPYNANINGEVYLVIKDLTNNFTVGRVQICVTVETSTISTINNQSIFIQAGDDNVKYTIKSNEIKIDSYASAMSAKSGGSPFNATLLEGDWTDYLYSTNSDCDGAFTIEENNNTRGTITIAENTTAWKKVSVDARLMFTKDDVKITKDIGFDDWKGDVGYSDFTDLGEDMTVKPYGTVKGGYYTYNDNDGTIKDVWYGETLTIYILNKTTGVISEDLVGEKYGKTLSWNDYKTSIDADSYDTYADFIGDENTITVDIGNLNSDGSITISNQTSSSVNVEITVNGEIKNHNATLDAQTYGKTLSWNDYKYNIGANAYSSYADFDLDGNSLELEITSASGVAFDSETGSITISNHSSSSIDIGYTTELVVNNNRTKVIEAFDLTDPDPDPLTNLTNFKSLIKDYLFTAETENMLGYDSWVGLLAGCYVYLNDSDEEFTGTTLSGSEKYSFKIITRNPAYNATFYIANQEADKTQVHYTGNVEKLGLSGISGTSWSVEGITTVDSDIDSYYVFPMATEKTIENINDYIVGNEKANAQLRAILGFDEKEEGSDDYIVSTINGTYELTPTSGLMILSTGAGRIKTQPDEAPFNTLSVMKNGYEIGKIHIYLEDYFGDKSYENFVIASKLYSSKTEVELTNSNGGLSIEIDSSDENCYISVILDVNNTYIINNNKYIVDGNAVKLVKSDGTSDNVALDGDNQFVVAGKTYQLKDGEICYNGYKITSYIVKNAVMEKSEDLYSYLLSDGTEIEFNKNNKYLYLKKCIKSDAAFNIEVFGQNFEVTDAPAVNEDYATAAIEYGAFGIWGASYFEGIAGEKLIGTCALDKESQIYKAEKTSNLGVSKIQYRDEITGDMFNFTGWEYKTSYVTASGEQVGGKTIEIKDENVERITVTISSIKNSDGEDAGQYIYNIDITTNPSVTIKGGDDNPISSSNPIDGKTIASAQSVEIAPKGDVFDIVDVNNMVNIELTTAPTSDDFVAIDGDDKLEVARQLYANSVLSCLIVESGSEKSNEFVLQKSKNDLGETIFVIGVKFGENIYYITEIDDNNKLTVTNSEGLIEVGDFCLYLNEDIYSFQYKKKPATSVPEGEETTDSTNTIVCISPKYSYDYQILTNSTAVDATLSGSNIAVEDPISIKANHVRETTVVKMKITLNRGDKAVATAYYALTINPSISVDVNYPTIKYNDGETQENIEYVNEGDFDVNGRSALSTKDLPRFVVYKTVYGTAGNDTMSITYNVDEKEITNIALNNATITDITDEGKEALKSYFIGLSSDATKEFEYNDKTYSIVYTTTDISYEATSAYNVINSYDSTTGKFNFNMSSITGISEVPVTISVKCGGLTFAQYEIKVCKAPIVSTVINAEITHYDTEGNEIIPISGSAINLFDTSTPRVRFVYNSKVLNSSYQTNNIITIDSSTSIQDYEDAGNEEGTKTVTFEFNGKDIGTYSYKTVWDYKYTQKQDEGYAGFDYMLTAGTYDVVSTFGFTKYFGGELGELNSVTVGTTTLASVVGNKTLTIYGAPNGGEIITLTIKPYSSETDVTINVKAMPAIEYSITYDVETLYKNEAEIYGQILYSTLANVGGQKNIVENGTSSIVNVSRNGIIYPSEVANLTFSLDASDISNAQVVTSGSGSSKLVYITGTPSKLDVRYIIVKVSDNYGYVDYLRFAVTAQNQVVVTNNDVEFTTGDTISWTEENPFPLQFKNDAGGAEYKYASMYEATIDGATSENTSDSIGISQSSLGVDASGKLYGVQLGTVITSGATKYIPYLSTISYDVYKTLASTTLKAFSYYSGKIDITGIKDEDKAKFYNDGTVTPNGNTTVIITIYNKEKSASDAKAIATITFTPLLVSSQDKLYVAGRENATKHYKFEYSINVEGQEFVGGTNKNEIQELGNAQYGGLSSKTTKLNITIKEVDGSTTTTLDTVAVDMLLKFKIHPTITYNASYYDNIAEGTALSGIGTTAVLTDGTEVATSATLMKYSVLGGTTVISGNATKKAVAKYALSSNSVTIDGITYSVSESLLSLSGTINSNTVIIDGIKYTYDSTNKKLTIGYKVVTLDDNNKYVDSLNGITYIVDGTTLSITKALNNNSTTIGGKTYKVEGEYLTITTNYEIAYFVWSYNSKTYWAQYNYKVVSRYNQIVDNGFKPSENQKIAEIYLTWEGSGWTFDPNSMTIYNGTSSYDVTITSFDESLKYAANEIDFDLTKMKEEKSFTWNGITFTQNTTSNSAWANNIKIKGESGNVSSLSDASSNITLSMTDTTYYSLTGTTISASNLISTGTAVVVIKNNTICQLPSGANSIIVDGVEYSSTQNIEEPIKVDGDDLIIKFIQFFN